jgi:4-hydroxy-tetrahydrodipicolinate synthase
MFIGIGTALVTPFYENGDVDYKTLKKLVNFQIENGVDSLVVLGTSAEAATLDFDERDKILDVVTETADKRIPIIAGTGTNNTADVLKFNKQAEKFGVDGLLIVNPYYNKGTQESSIKHYQYVSERTDLPILLYNVPSRTAMNLLPETVVEIADKCKNIVGIKESSGNISQIAHLFSIIPPNFLVYSGNDDQTLPIMALGGAGIISVFANVFPKQMKLFTTAIINNNFEKAREYNNRFISMMNLLFIETSPMPVKYVMSLMGLCENTLRLPLDAVTDKSKNILKTAYEKFIQA